MEKGKEVTSGSAQGPELPPAPASTKKRTCTIIKLVVGAIVAAVILYLVFGGDPTHGIIISNFEFFLCYGL